MDERLINFLKSTNHKLNGNTLLIEDDEKNTTYMLPLSTNYYFNELQFLIYLNPRDLYRIIYMFELLTKTNNSEIDKQFASEYMDRLIKLDNERLSMDNYDQYKENLAYCMNLPIAEVNGNNPIIVNNDIKDIIIKKQTDNETTISQNANMTKVLTLPQFYKSNPQDNDFMEKAGHTSMLLIIVATLVTIAYITFFMLTR